MPLVPPTLDHCQEARVWRNDALSALRTPGRISVDQQAAFHRLISSPQSPHRYYAAVDDGPDTRLRALAGLTHIQWENGLAEISLIVNPVLQRLGAGRRVVDQLLEIGFHRLRLETVVGECYETNPGAVRFWTGITAAYAGTSCRLPRRKFWQGRLFDALYFSITKEGFMEARS